MYKDLPDLVGKQVKVTVQHTFVGVLEEIRYKDDESNPHWAVATVRQFPEVASSRGVRVVNLDGTTRIVELVEE